MVLKNRRETAHCVRRGRRGQRERKGEKEERATEEINSCKIKKKRDVERITKIPSGKIVQEMGKGN